ncbi:MAG: hypothetical protein WDZ27_02540 [Waddliaceae bacterium]
MNILNFFIVSLVTIPFLISAEFTNYSPQLKTAIHLVNQMDEVNEILSEVEERIGTIRVEIKPQHTKFQALWNPDLKTIQLNKNAHNSLSDNIISIVFELHNAKTTNQMSEVSKLAQAGLLSRLEYIETMERIEYINALGTKSIIEKGVAKGIFPQNTHWNIPDSFDEHFNLQKMSGHSAWFSTLYNQMTGDLANKPKEIHPKSRRNYSEMIIEYVALKEKLQANSYIVRQDALRKVINTWERIHTGYPHVLNYRQQELISRLFGMELRSAGILTG